MIKKTYIGIIATVMSGLFMVSLQAMQDTGDSIYLLRNLSIDMLYTIVFPCGITVTEVTETNADVVKKSIKMFFAFNKTCKYFHENFEFPWLKLDLIKKNKMLQQVNLLMRDISYEQYSGTNDFKARSNGLFFGMHATSVSFGYKKYCVIPLALVYSGAGADITNPCSTTCLSKALHAQDELAVAWLLEHKADPCQKSFCEGVLAATLVDNPIKKDQIINDNDDWLYDVRFSATKERPLKIFFRAKTIKMLELFIKHVEESMILDSCAYQNRSMVVSKLFHSSWTPEVFKFWLDKMQWSWERPEPILHVFIRCFLQCWPDRYLDMDSFPKKIEFMLDAVPNMADRKSVV